MIVKSYLAYPISNGLTPLLKGLQGLDRCDAYASNEGDMVIVVTEADTEAEDQALLERIEAVDGMAHLAFVSAFNETPDSTE